MCIHLFNDEVKSERLCDHSVAELEFYNAAVTKPLAHNFVVVGSHTEKLAPVPSSNSFLDQWSRKL